MSHISLKKALTQLEEKGIYMPHLLEQLKTGELPLYVYYDGLIGYVHNTLEGELNYNITNDLVVKKVVSYEGFLRLNHNDKEKFNEILDKVLKESLDIFFIRNASKEKDIVFFIKNKSFQEKVPFEYSRLWGEWSGDKKINLNIGDLYFYEKDYQELQVLSKYNNEVAKNLVGDDIFLQEFLLFCEKFNLEPSNKIIFLMKAIYELNVIQAEDNRTFIKKFHDFMRREIFDYKINETFQKSLLYLANCQPQKDITKRTEGDMEGIPEKYLKEN